MSRAATARLKVNPPLGNMPVLQFVRPSDIRVDAAYQRSLETGASQTLIRRMAQHWNWDLCQPLVLARRRDLTERLFVIDGQHRLAAANLRGDIAQLPCVIVDYATQADEAASFVHLNQQRRPLTALDLFKAAVASEDPESCSILDAMGKAGLSVAPHSNSSAWKPGMVANLPGIRQSWRIHGGEVTSAAFLILGRAFSGQVLNYAGTIFPGIAAVCADEFATKRAFDGQRMARFQALLASKGQGEWRNAIVRMKAEQPTLNYMAVSSAALRRAWKEADDGRPVPSKAPAPVDPKQPRWCSQCEKRVHLNAASLCSDRFCKVRPAMTAAR